MSIKFTKSNSEILKTIEKLWLKDINAFLRRVAPIIEKKFEPVIRGALMNSPEIQSLKNGVLKGEFGLESDPTDLLIEEILATLKTRVVPAKKISNGGIEMVMQPSGYSNLLKNGFAYQEIKGGSIPWLSWLLTLGDSIIITGFGVEFGSFKSSRTGIARMSKDAGPYKVNSAYSGTVENNFITRAIESVYPELNNIFKGVL
jgi:hypothetical protein